MKKNKQLSITNLNFPKYFQPERKRERFFFKVQNQLVVDKENLILTG